MDLQQVKREIKELSVSPVAEKMYPISSEWVPVTDVLAIIDRFEKDLRRRADTKKNSSEAALMRDISGEA